MLTSGNDSPIQRNIKGVLGISCSVKDDIDGGGWVRSGCGTGDGDDGLGRPDLPCSSGAFDESGWEVDGLEGAEFLDVEGG